jgi:hypothetical protein
MVRESRTTAPRQTSGGGAAQFLAGPAPIPLFIPSPYAMPPDVAARFAANMIVRVAHDAAARFAAAAEADPAAAAEAAAAAAAAVLEEQPAPAPDVACERCGRGRRQAVHHPCMHVEMCVPCSRAHYPRGSHDEVPADPGATCTKCDETVSRIVSIPSTYVAAC